MRKTLLFVLLVLLANVGFVQAQSGYSCDDFSSAEAHAAEGRRLYDNGQYEEALPAFDCAIEMTSDYAYAYNMRGNVYYYLNDMARAIDDYTLALEYYDDDLKYIGYFNRGNALTEIGDYESAEADLNRAVELNPEYVNAYNGLGIIYYDQGDYDTAETYFNQALEQPADVTQKYPYYNLALIHDQRGDLQQALEAITGAIAVDENYDSAYLARAGINADLDNGRQHGDYQTWLRLINRETREHTGGLLNSEPFIMEEGLLYRVPFAGQEGQRLDVSALTVSGDELDPLVVILAPDNTPIASDDDSGVNLDAVIENFSLPTDGTYTLLLGHAGGGSDGEIALTISIDGSSGVRFTSYDLAAGDRVTVWTGGVDRLNLRSGPGLSFDIVERMEEGTVVTLLEGPRKASGYAWWRARTQDGVEGWAVERVDSEQTLLPVLEVGGKATVNTAGDLLNVREAPGTQNPVVIQLPDGTLVDVVGEPQVSDVYIWWQIQAPNGETGWAVERIGSDHILIGTPQR